MDHNKALYHLTPSYRGTATGRLKSMIGMTHLATSADSVSFKFKGCRRFDHATVILTPYDTYNLELRNLRRLELIPDTRVDVRFDQLADVFEAATGLRTTLG